MQQQNGTDEAQPLAVAKFGVQDRVRLEQVKQRQLTHPEGVLVVLVIGEGSSWRKLIQN